MLMIFPDLVSVLTIRPHDRAVRADRGRVFRGLHLVDLEFVRIGPDWPKIEPREDRANPAPTTPEITINSRRVNPMIDLLIFFGRLDNYGTQT